MTIRRILESLEHDTFVTLLFRDGGIVQGGAVTLTIYLDDNTLDRIWDKLTIEYGELTTISAR